MKNFIVGMLLVASAAHAEDLAVNVKNFSFNYDEPKGSGSATSFTLSGVPSREGVEVAVEKLDDVFKFSVTGAQNEELEFKDAPSFMKEANHMDIDSFNLDLSSTASLSLKTGNFNSPDSDLTMKGFSLLCNRDASQKEVMDQLLVGCMKKMTVRSSDFSSVNKKDDKHGLLVIAESIQAIVEKSSSRGGTTRVKSLKLNVETGKYDLAADISSGISGGVTSKGTMAYDTVKGEMAIKISEVKFSILNVTGKVFDELKKKQSPKFKVKQPYVYITVK